MTKLERFTKEIERRGFTIGCVDPLIERVRVKDLVELANVTNYGSGDVDIYINGRLYVAEVEIIDDEDIREVDVQILTQAEYISRYGNERWEDEY